MSKEDLTKIKDLSTKEISEKIRSGEIQVPPAKSKDRDEFSKFVSMSKEDREKYLSEEPKPEEKKDGDGKPVVPPVEPVREEKAPDKPPEVPWWKDLGYEDEAKAKDALASLREIAEKQRVSLDAMNAREGKRGQELKRLREENEVLQKKVKEVQLPEPALNEPKPPTMPNPKDFKDGVFDEGYVGAMATYNGEVVKWQTDFARFTKESVLREVRPKAEPTVPPPVNTEQEDATLWNQLFDQVIPDFQKRQSVETTVPVRRISDAYIVLSSQTATQAQKDQADALVKGLSKDDLEKYGKIKTVIENAYDFTSGIPIPRYKKIETALVDNDLIGEGKLFNTVVPVRLSKQEEEEARRQAQRKKDASESAPSSIASASGDPKITDASTTEEKVSRMRDLIKEYNLAMNKGVQAGKDFEASAKFKELVELQRANGYKSRFGR